MKLVAKLVIIALLQTPLFASAQYKYNIDIEPLKKRRLDFSYFFYQTKTSYKEYKEQSKKNRVQKKGSNATKRHTYNNQTKVVRNRMKKTEKRAKHFNRRTVPLRIKLKRLFYG